jgi:hypothetical protein
MSTKGSAIKQVTTAKAKAKKTNGKSKQRKHPTRALKKKEIPTKMQNERFFFYFIRVSN